MRAHSLFLVLRTTARRDDGSVAALSGISAVRYDPCRTNYLRVCLSNICYTLEKKEERNSLGDFQPKGRIGKLLYSFMYLLNCLL